MTKILVADDEADLESLIKQKFRKQIREFEYEFVFAINGRDAMDKLRDHKDIDMILSDINMPEMDGLTLLGKTKEFYPLLKSVIISAYGDMENIRTAMNRGAFDFITKPVNFDDLSITMEKTIAYVNQLKSTVKALKENNILRMYVDESVLNFMNQKPDETSLLVSENINASVAFIDITGFTKITEMEKPETVVKLLNQYFDVISKEVIKHGGYVDKFIGDEVMAVFKCDFHLDKTIDACLAVRKAIEQLPPSESGNYHPQVSIGVNSGEMISGNIGSEDLKRLDYTVIGDVVNTAKRMQSTAREGEIIVPESCYLKIKESFNFKKVGEVTLKNKSKPMVVYQVLD
ncbi:MAG: adenylate/guanylate cyclase domain-containing protein [Saprospiraceae bacterium]